MEMYLWTPNGWENCKADWLLILGMIMTCPVTWVAILFLFMSIL
jgi:hypothetical protein